MLRGTRSIDPDLAAIADPTESLAEPLKRLTAPTSRSVFKALSLNGEGEVKLVIEKFKEVAEENERTGRLCYTYGELYRDLLRAMKGEILEKRS